MPDNTGFYASLDPAAPKIADDEVPYSGDLAKVQIIQLGLVTGPEGSRVVTKLTDFSAGIGLPADTAAVSDTATASLVALFKRLLAVQAPATSTFAASGTGDVQMLPATPKLRLMGFTTREDAGVSAEFVLRHGTTTGDMPLAIVSLGPRESVREWFGPNGINAANGLFLDRVSGTMTVTIHTAVLP